MTSVGLSVKVSPAAASDAAATAVPQPGGEGDAFAQLMATVGTPSAAPAAQSAETPMPLPAAALLAGLAAVQAPGESELRPSDAVVAETPHDEAQQACCMIEIADLASRMLVAVNRPVRAREEAETDAPKSDVSEDEGSEGEAPVVEQKAQHEPTSMAAPVIQIPVAAPVVPPPTVAQAQLAADQNSASDKVMPTLEQKSAPGQAMPAAQIAAVAVLPKAATSGEPAVDASGPPPAQKTDTGEQAAPVIALQEKPVAVLPAPLRLAIQNLIAEKAPAFVRPEAQPASAPAPANDQPVAAPLPAVPVTSGSVIAMMQSQLAAVAAPAEPAPVADTNAVTPAAPELSVERELDMAKDNEWLDSLARDIASTTGRDATLRFRLHPQSLGTLQVEVAQSHAGTSVRLTADSEAARSIIADAQPRLIAEARAQGVRIAETHVGMELGSHHASDQRRQNENRQETFLRTAAGEAESHNEETTNAADGSAERFA